MKELLRPPPKASPAVPLPFEIEVEVQYTPLKYPLEALLMGILPFFVHYPERYIFVWRTSSEP